jgi:hypothetical protein
VGEGYESRPRRACRFKHRRDLLQKTPRRARAEDARLPPVRVTAVFDLVYNKRRNTANVTQEGSNLGITKKEIASASTEYLERLRDAVEREIEERKEKSRKTRAAEEHRKRHGTVHREYRKCGKENCRRCAEGEGHGPYFYRYYRDKPNGKLKSQYLGKELPD